jgi:hypothetical protein
MNTLFPVSVSAKANIKWRIIETFHILCFYVCELYIFTYNIARIHILTRNGSFVKLVSSCLDSKAIRLDYKL